jgi:3-dehydrosphinganine reductase
MNIRRTWLITGAASGLGRELSTQLARRGDKLVLWDRDAERLERSASLLGPAVVHSEIVDVVNPDATRAAAERATDAASRISRVVHCAGILRAGPALSMSATDYRAIMEVNFLGTVHVARALTPALIENGKPHDRSQLVLLGNVAALRGIPTLAAYTASKHAVLGFAQALHDELDGQPIDVRVVCPPPLDTPMVRNLPEMPAIYRLSPPQPVEKVARNLLAQIERGSGFMVLLDNTTKLLWQAQRALPQGVHWALRLATRR